MKTKVGGLAVCLLLALAAPAVAKGPIDARLRAPVPTDAEPGTTITVAWTALVQNDQPMNACGMFVQLKSASGGAATRGYADGPGAANAYPDLPACRAHPTGEYEAAVIVPDGGIAAVEFGVHGSSDFFFPPSAGERAPDLEAAAAEFLAAVLGAAAFVTVVCRAAALTNGRLDIKKPLR